MKTSTYQRLGWMVVVASVAVVAGCGPMYTEDRWYARDYYSHGAGPGYAQPQPVNVVSAEPMIAPDPQFADLTPYGQWETTGEYGRIWVPYANRTPGWRPYFYGQWQHTEWGWSWVSDEAWGAGPYHYGRWTWMNGRNWIWIPDYTWGPAWVTWSHGGGCVGWAPMGPGGATWVDIHAHSTYWTYVPTAQFGGAKVQHVVVTAADVPRIHAQTVIVDNGAQIRGNNGSVVTYNQGPARDQVQQWTARPVDTRPIDQVPSVQPRRIPDNVQPPTGGTYGSATQPPPTRVSTPGNPPTGTPTVPTRPGSGGTGVTTPNPTVPTPFVPDPRTPNPGTPTRPGVGVPPTTPVTPPTRPGVGLPVPPITAPPTRPGVGTPTTDPPTRPGAGYTGPGPIDVPAQPTVPRPSPPPVDRGNYAPPPARYVPPTYTPPTNNTNTAPNRQNTPTYTLPNSGSSPSYQPTRPATPSYSPPTYNSAPSYQPSYQPSRAAPSYSPPSYQPSRAAAPSYSPPAARFSPPPSYSPSPSRPATSSAPAPTRRR